MKRKIASNVPSLDEWLAEAKENFLSHNCGMFLFHNGIVRKISKATVREGVTDDPQVVALELSYDKHLLLEAEDSTYVLPGVYYVRTWINEGILNVGDSMMLVLVGADTRDNCIFALEQLLKKIKTEVVIETEIFS